MSSKARVLLEQATPLPWTYRAVADAYLYDDGDFPPSPVNLDLAVAAVNRLPDYLAAVEALEHFVESWGGNYEPIGRMEDCEQSYKKATAVLARLRESVSA